MRFPKRELLRLPCHFERFVPGDLHPDGKRYLPLLILRPLALPRGTGGITPPDFRIGVIDRHHRVAQSDAGRTGIARLTLLLGSIRLQQPPYRQGLLPEAEVAPGHASTNPFAFGQIREVLSWETERTPLPYEVLYAELLLDIGIGTIGIRTSVTATDMASTIGGHTMNVGDWITVARSRVDMLEFQVAQM